MKGAHPNTILRDGLLYKLTISGDKEQTGRAGGAGEVGEEMIVAFEYIDCPLVENNLQGKADNLNEGSLSAAWVQENSAEITLPQVVRSVRKAS